MYIKVSKMQGAQPLNIKTNLKLSKLFKSETIQNLVTFFKKKFFITYQLLPLSDRHFGYFQILTVAATLDL